MFMAFMEQLLWKLSSGVLGIEGSTEGVSRVQLHFMKTNLEK